MKLHPLHTWSPSSLTVLAICVALAQLSACKRSEEAPAPKAAPQQAAPQRAAPTPRPFQVTRIDVGNAIDADKKVTAPSGTFKPGDTIYASIVSDGAAANVSLSVRWTFQDGRVINESTQNLAPAGPAVTEFHISKPDGWPAGKYKLEVTANGKLTGAVQFTVTE